jgi:ABC-type antimicrobial peptide transport system, permease component
MLAIAISVAFLAGSSVLVATEAQAQGKAANLPIAKADLVVTNQGEPVTGITEALAAVPGVAVVNAVGTTSEVVTNGAISQLLQLFVAPPEPLRWSKLVAGRWPDAAEEIALSAAVGRALNVGIGGGVRVAGSDTELQVVGLTDEPAGMFVKTGYTSSARLAADGWTADASGEWAISAVPGTNLDLVVDAINAELARIAPGAKAELGQVVRDRQASQVAGELDAFNVVLWVGAAASVVVGMITIANTFTITLAQRRRQIGLLRAVGASAAQVRFRFLAEAALLGVIGSLIGVLAGIGIAAGITAWSSALYWGLALPWPRMAIAFGIGVLVAVIAAIVPVLRGTKVAPVEALQPELSVDERKRAGVVRAVVCGLLLAAGLGVAVLSVSRPDPNALLYAIGAGTLISLGVLFGGPLFVPGLLRLVGRVVRPLGTVPLLAANNTERNPRRATATATALMLAVGLVVTMQVTTASIRASILGELEVRFPVDVQVAWTDAEGRPASVPDDVRTGLAGVPGVAETVALPAGQAQLNGTDGPSVALLGAQPTVASVAGIPVNLDQRQVLVSPQLATQLPASVEVAGDAGSLTLQVVGSKLVGDGQAMVSAANLDAIVRAVPAAVVWLSVPDRSQALNVLVGVNELAGDQNRVTGSLVEASAYETLMNLLVAITTGLLGVAVVIALIGVSNTLGLSVLERTRESGLLRALGLQASSLRAMLTIEALEVALVGVLVGTAAGAGFGWLAITALGRASDVQQLSYTIDGPQTTAMLAIAVVAAALASFLPGRRAARTAPTEALAEL